MKIFSSTLLDALFKQAKGSPRLRQHHNIHLDFGDPCQRLFNAIEPDSYIRPHRHSSVPREELLIAVRGLMALVTFDDVGELKDVVRFGTEKYGVDTAAGVEVYPDTWHTVLALVPGCVLLEVKAGPFDPKQPKDLAAWAPDEGTENASAFLAGLKARLQ